MKIDNDGMTFDNVSEFYDLVTSPVSHSYGRHSQSYGDANWTGTQTFEQAMQLARNGWPEGLQEAAKFNLALEDTLSGHLYEPEVRWQIEGDWIDVGRFTSGEPETFGSIVETEIERSAMPPKIVHIVCNVCVSAGVDTHVIIRRGAAMVALVDMLERHGRRVEIDIIAPNKNPDQHVYHLNIRAKEANEPLQLDKLMFLMAHPACLRRLIFSAWEHAPAEIIRSHRFRLGQGYGRVGEAPETERGDIYLGGADLHAARWDMKFAESWIIRRLVEQGIAVREGEGEPA